MQSDSELIVSYREGHTESFELLVERYLNHIYNFVFKYVANRDEAADITQEIFVKIWKNLRKFDITKNFKIWIFVIARRTIIDELRKRKSVAFSQLDSEEYLYEETLEDPQPLQDEIFFQRESAAKVSNALLKLLPQYRLIAYLHIHEGLTFADIAEVLDKPLNTVKSYYRRALHMLEKNLA